MSTDSGRNYQDVERGPEAQVSADYTRRRGQRELGATNVITVIDATWGPEASREEGSTLTQQSAPATAGAEFTTDYPSEVEATGIESADLLDLDLARRRVDMQTRNMPRPDQDRFDIPA